MKSKILDRIFDYGPWVYVGFCVLVAAVVLIYRFM
ncbi:hypothetical protein EDD75_1381 [Thermodesulfitimonas autotrophica]|uniref:Uncharacterized protein n=1 Tax=Thermodesulfitimonas autotrophica TaxID=1894989 RepID=A0A3N5BBV7_9THEO|nr:hypothetical protein EDD75_1381 [Thermodesulfitimonas autotrophica]